MKPANPTPDELLTWEDSQLFDEIQQLRSSLRLPFNRASLRRQRACMEELIRRKYLPEYMRNSIPEPPLAFWERSVSGRFLIISLLVTFLLAALLGFGLNRLYSMLFEPTYATASALARLDQIVTRLETRTANAGSVADLATKVAVLEQEANKALNSQIDLSNEVAKLMTKLEDLQMATTVAPPASANPGGTPVPSATSAPASAAPQPYPLVQMNGKSAYTKDFAHVFFDPNVDTTRLVLYQLPPAAEVRVQEGQSGNMVAVKVVGWVKAEWVDSNANPPVLLAAANGQPLLLGLDLISARSNQKGARQLGTLANARPIVVLGSEQGYVQIAIDGWMRSSDLQVQSQ